MNTCSGWRAAVEAAPELFPVVQLEVPALQLHPAAIGVLSVADHADGVQGLMRSAAACPGAHGAVRVRLAGPHTPHYVSQVLGG